MQKFDEIDRARRILELEETADLATIKANYRRLMAQFHPDRCSQDRQSCEEMAKQLSLAYRLLSEYCRDYRYSFSRDTVRRHLPADQWWSERFGVDPAWARVKK